LKNNFELEVSENKSFEIGTLFKCSPRTGCRGTIYGSAVDNIRFEISPDEIRRDLAWCMSEVAFRSRGFLKIGRSKLGVCLYVALRQDVAARHKVVPWSMSAYVVFPREEISGGGSGIILRSLSSWSEKVKVSNLLGYVEPSRAIALCISMYFANVYFFKGVAFKFIQTRLQLWRAVARGAGSLREKKMLSIYSYERIHCCRSKRFWFWVYFWLTFVCQRYATMQELGVGGEGHPREQKKVWISS
jgi:hypothetical protein